MISFSRRIKEGNFSFFSEDYKELLNHITQDSFVYLDPPYELTTSSYNDGKRGFKGWNKDLEAELFSVADQINAMKIPFMLSYVVEHKGKINQALLDWVDRNNYHIIQLGDIIGISGSRRKEVLIVNYGI